MANVVEINQAEQLADYRVSWAALLQDTPGANFFQSLDWLEVYWRHYGASQTLRVLMVSNGSRLQGIVPMVVRREQTTVGPLRVLTFPLHDWGSFYGPIGCDSLGTLHAAFEHIANTRRDWDIIELRWQGGPSGDAAITQQAMLDSGYQAYATLWDQTAIVDFTGTWQSYWASRKGSWLRRYRRAERELASLGRVSHVRYRPQGMAHADGDPRWDLYDACEEVARRSWQGKSPNGTTLSHESVRPFLRDVHTAAAALGAVDLNLLMIDDRPVAFVYGYCYRGQLYGLRRGYDAELAPRGAGNVLLGHVLQDSFARGDKSYDLGVGSLDSKRYFQTRTLPILRFSHYPPLALRTQLLRLKRWWDSRTNRPLTQNTAEV